VSWELVNQDRAALTGLPVAPCQHLAGSKVAVRHNGVTYLSPAMWDLVTHASHKELVHLLAHIKVIEIPSYDFQLPAVLIGTPRPNYASYVEGGK
jgi:hypothetical protein